MFRATGFPTVATAFGRPISGEHWGGTVQLTATAATDQDVQKTALADVVVPAARPTGRSSHALAGTLLTTIALIQLGWFGVLAYLLFRFVL